MADFPIKDTPIVKTQYCPNCEAQATEVERLQAEAQARYDRGYYDGITHPLGQSDAMRDQLLRECLVKLRDVQGTEAPKQYACNLIKRVERVLKNQRT